MHILRWVFLVLLAAVMIGSLSFTGGFACHLRSDAYRNDCAEYLSRALELPSEIGRVVPRSRRSREFQDVRVYLPQRRGLALHTERAIVAYTPTPTAPNDYEIELIDGTCEISTRTWLRGDYRQLVEAGLRPGFDPTGPRRVRFTGFDLRFERDGFRAELVDAGGVVLFEHEMEGVATISCERFNGHKSDAPVVLKARFSPRGRGATVDSLQLLIPTLPLEILRLESLAGIALQSGRFRGNLNYAEKEDTRRLIIAGEVYDLHLSDVTAPFVPRPWRGVFPEIEMEELSVLNGELEHVRFRGVARDVELGDALAPLGFESLGGHTQINVTSADLRPQRISRLALSGKCVELSLETLSDRLGWGKMTGTADISIDDLTIENDHISSLSASVRVRPSETPNWIERRLIVEVLQRAFGKSVPGASMLPERIPYAQLGLRVELRDEVMRIYGTHGDGQRALLTLQVGGMELPVITESLLPEKIDLRSAMDDIRTRVATYLQERADRISATQAWHALSTRPTTRPTER